MCVTISLAVRGRAAESPQEEHDGAKADREKKKKILKRESSGNGSIAILKSSSHMQKRTRHSTFLVSRTLKFPLGVLLVSILPFPFVLLLLYQTRPIPASDADENLAVEAILL